MGVELIFEAIAAAKAAGRKLTIACTSALTDMAQCLGHPRCESEPPAPAPALTPELHPRAEQVGEGGAGRGERGDGHV